MTDGSNWIAPTNPAMRTTPPPATAIRPARMNLRQLSILAASSAICASSWTISTRWSLSFVVAHGGQHARTATLVVVGFSVIINIVTISFRRRHGQSKNCVPGYVGCSPIKRH
jgi:hypothetical protein